MYHPKMFENEIEMSEIKGQSLIIYCDQCKQIPLKIYNNESKHQTNIEKQKRN